jgi:hypothetical protein
MKNLHILPTDKPSRFVFIGGTSNSYHLLNYNDNDNYKSYNICITNDEEIKKGDWVLFTFNDITEIVKVTTVINNAFETKQGFGYGLEYCKKIILTTDQDLIKDGVQSIDNEFLEWFVKNPSCESVEVREIEDELISSKNPKIRFNALQDPPSFISAESLNNMILTYKYKIIILQEEYNNYN